MPYSIITKDGIRINNIPDSVDRNSDELKQRVAQIRAEREPQQQPAQPAPQPKLTPQQLAVEQSDLPTAQNLELEQQRAIAQQQPELTLGEQVYGGLEALATMGTGATTGTIAGAGGGLVGALGELTGILPEGEGEKLMQDWAGALTFQPKTRAGQELVGDIGEVLGALPAFMGSAPLQTTRVAMTPSFKTMQQVGKQTKKQGTKGIRAGQRVLQSASETKKALVEEIRAGNRNAGNIAKTLDADGTLINNPNMKQAINLMGDNDAAYNLALDFERLSPATKTHVNKALDVIRDNKFIGGRKQASQNRPIDVAAKPIERRIEALQKIHNKASERIGELMDGDAGKKPVKVNQPLNDFIAKLREEKIDVIPNEDGSLSVDLSKATNNARAALDEQPLNNILTELSKGNVTAKQAHGLKRDLRNMVNFDNKPLGATKPTDEIERAIKGLASDLSTAVKNEVKGYAIANKHMEDGFDALKMADRLLGKKLELGSEGATQKLAGIANKVATNYPSRQDAPMLVKELDKALAKRGIKYKDDAIDLVYAMQDLEDIFNLEYSQASRSIGSRMFAGELAADMIADPTGVTAASKKGIGIITDLFNKMPAEEFDDKMKAVRALSRVNK